MQALPQLQYPTLFRGFFSETKARYGALLDEARLALSRLPVPEQMRFFYEESVLQNPQPSFMLLPVIFLRLAETTGGIKEEHRRFLPVLMLMMEATAIADDTADRTMMRSGRESFAGRFGEGSAALFLTCLSSLMLEEARRCSEPLYHIARNYFLELFAKQLWERNYSYPKPEDLKGGLFLRYEECIVGSRIAFDTSRLISQRPLLSDEVVLPFCYAFQDVDDIVNLAERRERSGENDDLKMGIITQSLLLALSQKPSLQRDLYQLWEPYRALQKASLHELSHRCKEIDRETEVLYGHLCAEILRLGVPGTVDQIFSNLRACVEAAPQEVKSVFYEIGMALLDRLRQCYGADLAPLVGSRSL